MHNNYPQRKRLILSNIITIGSIILCLAFIYSRYNSNPHKPVVNPPTDQSLNMIKADNFTFLSHDPQVKDIWTRWQAIETLFGEKDYSPLCQPRYLYQKSHYIRALALGAFNMLLLPSVWLYIVHVFWGSPLTIFDIPVSFFSWEIGELRLAVAFLVIESLYIYVYQLCEHLIGERLIIHGSYTPIERQEIKALQTATQTLLTQRDLTPLDDTSKAQMEKLCETLLCMKEAYKNVLEAKNASTIQSKQQSALKECQQVWIAKYAKHYENRKLQRLSKDLQKQVRLVNYMEHN